MIENNKTLKKCSEIGKKSKLRKKTENKIRRKYK
jgi:hypothetical protein